MMKIMTNQQNVEVLCPCCTTKWGQRKMTLKDGVYSCGCGFEIKNPTLG